MLNQQYKLRWVWMTLLILSSLNVTIQEAYAQPVVVVKKWYPRRVYWGYYDPYYALSSRIYAQADLIRAQGEASVNYAEARNLHAEAYSKELDNWVKHVRAHWDRKIIREQKLLELQKMRQIKKLRYLNDLKWRNSRYWDMLENHPELSDSHVRNGSALNFMLARFVSAKVPFDYEAAISRFGPEAIEQVAIGKDNLEYINLKNGAFVFPAHQKADGKLNDWPYLLRWEAFNDSRAAVEKALEKVTKDKYNVEDLKALRQRLYELTKAFHGSNEVRDWVRDNKGYGHFQTADRFLRRLDRKITTVESTGDLRPFRGQNVFDPETHCANVISLICFMNRNGVKFERPATGAEHVYYDLFAKMRALYLDVVESDSSIRPEDLTELAK